MINDSQSCYHSRIFGVDNSRRTTMIKPNSAFSNKLHQTGMLLRPKAAEL